ncbi:MAG: hypothetical protein ACXVA9_03535 [Bdellovibrionales bacterium]
MQNQIEAAVRFGKTWLVGNLSVEGGPPSGPNYGMLTSNRLYAMTNITDEFYVRGGKFSVPFGINQPNHMAVIAQNLGWGTDTESDNFEAGYISEKYNLIMTADFGRPDHASLQAERGLAVNAAYNLGTTYKLGWSAFSGNGSSLRRLVTGPYATLAFSRKLVLLTQADMQWSSNKDSNLGGEQRGLVTFNRLQYEVYQGVQPYLVHQVSYLNTDKVSSRYDSYGAGVIWFPRPHFEFWGEWDKERLMSASADYSDSAWIVGHYYF